MRYLSLALIALGALMFPFAAKNAILGLSDAPGNPLRTAIILLIVGVVLIAAGSVIAKRDEISTSWRNRSRGTRRIRLR
jgi:uncharacterized protein YjeT (DUF2065 family)